MKVFITGASGFTGRFMLQLLASRGNIDITGLARNEGLGRIHAPHLSWNFADLRDPKAIRSAISAANPDAVLHLAGLTRGTMAELRAANVDGTENLLEAVLHHNPSCPVIVVSSSAVYGYAGTTPIKETQALQPVTDYGISKVEQEALCQRYLEKKGCRISIARPFNLVGPGQPDSFVCGRIIRQIVERKRKIRSALELAETGSLRDFIESGCTGII